MDGIIIETTVTKPLIGKTLIGQNIWRIFPKATAIKYINTLFLSFVKNKHQWCDYTIAKQVFVVLVEWIKGTQTFVAHETPYEGSIHDIQLRLLAAANNFRKTQN